MTFIKAKTQTNKIAAVTLSVAAGLATLAMPITANAQNYYNNSYEACKSADKEAQLVGGLLGAVVGGVLGSQVSGNGARTEGSVLGAVLGGAAGAGIGDGQHKCGTNTQYNQRQTTTYDRGYAPAPAVYNSGNTYGGSVVTVGHSGYNNRSTTTRGYDRAYDPGYDRRDRRLRQIEYRIEQTRREIDRLERRARYNGRHYPERRINELGRELKRLKKERKRVKRS